MMAVDPGGSTHERTERSLRSENILVLDIFFEALNYETIEQKKAYEVAALLGKSKRLLHKFPHLMGGEREGVAGRQLAGRSSSKPPDKSSSMPVIVPSILVRLLPQNAKTSSVVQVLGQFMHSLPQFPHQHREAGGRKISQGLSRAALLDSMVLCPQIGGRVLGCGRKKELSGAGKIELWRVPMQWTQ